MNELKQGNRLSKVSRSLQIKSVRWNDRSTRTSLNNTARSISALCRPVSFVGWIFPNGSGFAVSSISFGLGIRCRLFLRRRDRSVLTTYNRG